LATESTTDFRDEAPPVAGVTDAAGGPPPTGAPGGPIPGLAPGGPEGLPQPAKSSKPTSIRLDMPIWASSLFLLSTDFLIAFLLNRILFDSHLTGVEFISLKIENIDRFRAIF
jgi:hypothetical protein